MNSAQEPLTEQPVQPSEQQVDITNQSFWKSLGDALRGTDADYTHIPLSRAIFLLAIPMILELVMESTFAVADIYFVGKLGSDAIATVGLTETVMFLLYSVAMGLSVAATSIIARKIGEKKSAEASTYGAQVIIVGILVSIPFMIAGIFFARDVLQAMGGNEWSITHGYRYTQWMLGGNVVIVLLFVINAVFRGAGDAAIAMKVLIVSNLINIVLDPALIFGWGPLPKLGIEGAAIATNIGRGTAVAVQLFTLFRGGKHIRVMASNFAVNNEALVTIYKTSLGGIGQMIIAMTSWILLMRVLADVGSTAVAGATLTTRLMMFTLMPAWGLSNAAATLVGQNLGAGKPDRAEQSVWKIGFVNMIFLIGVSICFYFYSRELIGIFTTDKAVIDIGAQWLRILSYSYFVYGWWMVAVQAFNGSGDTTTPTKINVVFFWLIQIPLAYVMALHLNWGAPGVFWAAFISETSVGLFTLWLFTRGKWKVVAA